MSVLVRKNTVSRIFGNDLNEGVTKPHRDENMIYDIETHIPSDKDSVVGVGYLDRNKK